MFRMSDALGICEDGENQKLYELSSKIITISLLKILEAQKFALKPARSELLQKINHDTMPGFVENKVAHLFEALKDNAQFYTPDIFEEFLINEALECEIQIKFPKSELKNEIVNQIGEEAFKEWEKLLQDFCNDYCESELADKSEEVRKNYQKKQYRQIYNMCIDPRLSYKDKNTDNCGVLYWDYDFKFFYEKNFWEIIDMWCIVGSDRGYSIKDLCVMLETGGYAPFSDSEIAKMQLTQDQKSQEATRRYMDYLNEIICQSENENH